MDNESNTDGDLAVEASRLVRCCFNCADWRGVRRSDRGYCQRWNLSGKDATQGNDFCVAWNKRGNARLPSSNTVVE